MIRRSQSSCKGRPFRMLKVLFYLVAKQIPTADMNEVGPSVERVPLMGSTFKGRDDKSGGAN